MRCRRVHVAKHYATAPWKCYEVCAYTAPQRRQLYRYPGQRSESPFTRRLLLPPHERAVAPQKRAGKTEYIFHAPATTGVPYACRPTQEARNTRRVYRSALAVHHICALSHNDSTTCNASAATVVQYPREKHHASLRSVTPKQRICRGAPTLDLLALRQYLRCLLYTSPSPRDRQKSRMPSSA